MFLCISYDNYCKIECITDVHTFLSIINKFSMRNGVFTESQLPVLCIQLVFTVEMTLQLFTLFSATNKQQNIEIIPTFILLKLFF